MRVFVTGATGWVGSALVKELIAAGHHVLGLTRSDKGAEALTAAGAEIHRGSLADLDSLRSGAAQSDGVVHTAFNHDFSKFAENCAEDQRAIEAIGAVLEGSDRPLLVTSGVALLAPGRTATEEDVPPFRLSLLSPQIGGGDGRAGGARRTGIDRPARPVGAWPRRSRLRAAPDRIRAREGRVRLYRRGAQPLAGRAPARRRPRLPARARARRARRGPSMRSPKRACRSRQIAEVIGRRLNIPVVSKSPEEAAEHFGWFAMFAGIDAPTSSERTRASSAGSPNSPGSSPISIIRPISLSSDQVGQ